MAKYRKKPVIVDAEQFWPADKSRQWWKLGVHRDERYISPVWELDTSLGGVEVEPGDWIITPSVGDPYRCKPAVFEQTYDAVTKE